MSAPLPRELEALLERLLDGEALEAAERARIEAHPEAALRARELLELQARLDGQAASGAEPLLREALSTPAPGEDRTVAAFRRRVRPPLSTPWQVLATSLAASLLVAFGYWLGRSPAGSTVTPGDAPVLLDPGTGDQGPSGLAIERDVDGRPLFRWRFELPPGWYYVLEIRGAGLRTPLRMRYLEESRWRPNDEQLRDLIGLLEWDVSVHDSQHERRSSSSSSGRLP